MINRVSRIALSILTLSALVPALPASEIENRNTDRFFEFSLQSFYGNDWFLNALSNPAARLTRTNYVIDSAGDRVFEAAYVGDLRNPYSSDNFVFTAPYFRSGSGSTLSSLVPNAPTVDATTILWSSAGGSAWLTGTNWTGGAVPNGTQVAEFGVNPTPGTSVGINFNGTTNAGTQVNGQKIQEVGAVYLNSNRAIGLSIGNSSATAGATGKFRLNGVTVNGIDNVIIRSNSSQTLTIQNTQGSGNQTMSVLLGNATDNVINIDGTGNVAISSIIQNDAGNHITLGGTGTGSLILSGANTYTGGTTVNSGTLLANTVGPNSATGSGAVTVNNSGTLGGTGNINAGSNNITIDTPAKITGGTNGTVGTLTLAANTLVINGTYLNDINGATADRITLTGNLTLAGATIDFNTAAAPTAPTYTLLSYTGTLTGTFSVVDLPMGYDLVYNANSIDLVAIPEPGTWIGAGLALLVIGYTQRRRFTKRAPAAA